VALQEHIHYSTVFLWFDTTGAINQDTSRLKVRSNRSKEFELLRL